MLASLAELEDRLSEPSPQTVAALAAAPGDIALIGAGGKMGPTLARMICRGLEQRGEQVRKDRRVFAVSRFTNRPIREQLDSLGVETIACDLLADDARRRLPEADNIIYMTGFKFGAARSPADAWAMNCLAPARVAEHYAARRLVAFSSGNVYGYTRPESGGSTEDDAPRPISEYGMTVLGRERMFEYFSRRCGSPTAILRLNYATEMRYGVLVDIGRRVAAGEPIDLGMGWVNVIWQGDANAAALVALAHGAAPARVLNLAGPEILSVRQVAERFGELFGRPPEFTGSEAETALLNNASRGARLWGPPRIAAQQLIEWTAHWLDSGLPTWDKPTRYEVRDGRF